MTTIETRLAIAADVNGLLSFEGREGRRCGRHGARRTALAVGMVVVVAALLAQFSATPISTAHAETSDQTGNQKLGAAPPPDLAANALHQEPTCASSGDVLGLSRVVEIDTASGPEFGGSHGHQTDFLKNGEIVLTFDDGPLRPYTTAVLKALAAHCTKATFFSVGRMAMADPDMLKKTEAAGHTIGSHTWSHKNLKSLSGTRGIEEMEMGISAVSRALGKPIAPFFRYPYLSESKGSLAHAKQREIGTFWIDVDSVDYRTKDPDVMHRRVMSQLKKTGKGIILMHDIQRSTAHGLMGLLDDLHKHGYKVVHMVPKGQLSTVSAFDTSVGKAFDAKAKTKVGKPLADRSIVWSAEKPVVKSEKPTPAAAKPEVLPWQKAGDPADATPSSKTSTSSRKREEEVPWQMQIFDY